MHGPEPFVLALLVVLGLAALIFGIIYTVLRLIGSALCGVGRLLTGRVKEGRAVSVRVGHAPAASNGPRVCPRPACRHVEYRAARYCAHCGHPMDD